MNEIGYRDCDGDIKCVVQSVKKGSSMNEEQTRGQKKEQQHPPPGGNDQNA